MESVLRKIILRQVMIRAIAVLMAVFSALCVAAYAPGVFVTKTPVKVPQCQRYNMNDQIARNLHPECVRYEA